MLGDLFGGHVGAGCGGVTDFLVQHQADKVRIVAVSSPKRLPVLRMWIGTHPRDVELRTALLGNGP